MNDIVIDTLNEEATKNPEQTLPVVLDAPELAPEQADAFVQVEDEAVQQ